MSHVYYCLICMLVIIYVAILSQASDLFCDKIGIYFKYFILIYYYTTTYRECQSCDIFVTLRRMGGIL